MITYFKELLTTLKAIEKHLALIASCVRNNGRGYGAKKTLTTSHWNDSL